MFDTSDFDYLNPKYFIIVYTDAYDITLKSRNTGHYWYLHLSENPVKTQVIIYHKHEWARPYHFQKRVISVRQALQVIKSHDKWQIIQNKKNHKCAYREHVWSVYR